MSLWHVKEIPQHAEIVSEYIDLKLISRITLRVPINFSLFLKAHTNCHAIVIWAKAKTNNDDFN